MDDSFTGGKTLAEWPVTPAAVLDRTLLQKNLAHMAARARGLGVPLRPHLKTAKCREVAALARAAGADRFTVSTLREAEYFFSAGYSDLLYAVGIEPGKFSRAADLLRRGANLLVTCDSVSVATALAQTGAGMGVRFPVLVEIDCGEHRGGIAPDSPALLEIACALGKGSGAILRGVMSHSGHSYQGRSVSAHAAVGEHERTAVTEAAHRLRGGGFSCEIVSLGSTPVAEHAGSLAGITELRCGVFMFGDLFQAAIGSCRREDIALTVLTAVIGHRPDSNLLLVDAGALALSKDISTQKLGGEKDCAYGLVATIDGELIPKLRVETVYQEHGMISSSIPFPFEEFPIGLRLRILPNHACLTAAAYGQYVVVDGTTEVTAVWGRENGW